MLVVNTYKMGTKYMHSAGSICLVSTMTFASSHVIIICCLKCLSIFRCAFLAIELVMSASIIIVCSGGFLLLLIGGCVPCICFLKMDAWIELRSLFV
jgi:hypothetical protein